MSNIDKTVHSEEKIINEPGPVPNVANPVAECEMDALLLGRIGVSLVFFCITLITALRNVKNISCGIVVFSDNSKVMRELCNYIEKYRFL